ncbi:MAG: 3-deoxy-7-phosphoheptulonate synthase [Acidobacteriota bacterium]|nr:3-deoxy-7-phosphoheptulonate synthase [Blastocatellia bacterium]MDW8412287.1 3-deoxy-7-phosphoheptulonate synthase [Acidobacteriota bacterium]
MIEKHHNRRLLGRVCKTLESFFTVSTKLWLYFNVVFVEGSGMLIAIHPKASDKDLANVVQAIEKMGLTAQLVLGNDRMAIVVKGDAKTEEFVKSLELLPAVAEVTVAEQQWYLVGRKFCSSDTVVQVGQSRIGSRHELAIIAGPCAVESAEQTFAVADVVAACGIKLFRGGAYKPRTSPYTFQGLGLEGLRILAEVRSRYGLAIVTEAMDEESLELVDEHADMIQIGARNMQNFSLLKKAGRSSKPILLKRGMSATLDEFLLAAEYILAEGNPNVVLCERGIRTFVNHSRNTLDLSVVPLIRRLSHLPIIVDPSHACGIRELVLPLARASVAVGASGVMVEVHCNPQEALSDGQQALLPEMLAQMCTQLRAIHSAVLEKT